MASSSLFEKRRRQNTTERSVILADNVSGGFSLMAVASSMIVPERTPSGFLLRGKNKNISLEERQTTGFSFVIVASSLDTPEKISFPCQF